MKKNIFYVLLFLSFLSLQSKSQNPTKHIAMDTSANCLSQENKQKIYSTLKDLILKNGITAPLYDGYSTTRFIHDNMSFKYCLEPGMELISVYDMKGKEANYNIISDNPKVFIEVRNSPAPKSVKTQKMAEQHFCQVLCKMNFNITSTFKDTAGNTPRHTIQFSNFNNIKEEKEAVQFVDFSLKKNGNFGGDGDFSEGIIEIFEYYDMSLSNEDEYYGLSLQTSNGYLASMRINKKNHSISNTQFGRRN